MRGLTREICRLCHEVSRVGFRVPDATWKEVALQGREHDPICLRCFTRIADEKSIPWDNEIEFYPVSRTTHLDANATERGDWGGG